MTQVETNQSPTTQQMSERPWTAPPTDIYEGDDAYILVAEVPGARPDEIDVHLEEGELSFYARAGALAEGETLAGDYTPVDFRRRFTVGRAVDASKIEARLDNGLLTIVLPRSGSSAPRQIPVMTG